MPPDQIAPVTPRLELLGHFRAELGEPLELGPTLWGRRRVIPIAGGALDGPRAPRTAGGAGADRGR